MPRRLPPIALTAARWVRGFYPNLWLKGFRMLQRP